MAAQDIKILKALGNGIVSPKIGNLHVLIFMFLG